MRVWMIASEVAPFSKSGGLGDVAGALPRALAELGVEVTVVTPLYRRVWNNGAELNDTGIRLSVPMGETPIEAQVFASRFPDSPVRVYFVRMDYLYGREGLYGGPKGDYLDNCARFTMLDRAAMELGKALKVEPDIFHSHDWQAALVPVYQKTIYANAFPRAATVFTIHNMAYQGIFWHWDMPVTGLDWRLYNWRELEFYGKFSFIKGGVVFGDRITTVSPTYAREIQLPEFGHGLDPVLRYRGRDLVGVLNGVDYTEWDPERDRMIAATYTAEDPSGKAACKAALQKELGLRPDPQAPIIGLVSRFASQKGWDIILPAAPTLVKEGAQFAICGEGEDAIRRQLEPLAAVHPGSIAVRVGFQERVAHRIQAGADMLLVPSRYEPCGLIQMYALKYGTIPVVRATGGLADTVIDCTEATLEDGTATGFSFAAYSAEALTVAALRAMLAYRNPARWRALMRNAMTRDFSWRRSAKEYLKLYESLSEERR